MIALESDCKARLMEDLRRLAPAALAFRLEDKFASGRPDIVLVDGGATSWWEGKVLGRGRVAFGPAAQIATALRLDERGTLCRYVVWSSDGAFAAIVDPRAVWNHYHGTGSLPSPAVPAAGLGAALLGEHRSAVARLAKKYFARGAPGALKP